MFGHKGREIGAPGHGRAALLLMVNGRDMDASFELPPGDWVAELDTTAADGRSSWRRGAARQYLLPSRSVVLLRDASPN